MFFSRQWKPARKESVGLSVTGVAVILLSLVMSCASAAELKRETERRGQQAELNRSCELARHEALAPIRRRIYAECMKKRNDHDYCFSDAGSYDGERQSGKARFYDLPECVKAFKFGQAHRERY